MTVRYFFFVISFLVVTVFSADAQAEKTRPQKQPLKRIVIDPGHGGSASQARKFYGASGKHMEEKDIGLAVGLLLRDVLKEEMPDIEVTMTRTTDVFDHPVVKANKANAAKGDLFISLHCNGMDPLVHREITGYTTKTVKRKGKKVVKKIPEYRTWTTPYPASGTETYIWGVGKTKDKEEALSENNFNDTTMLTIKQSNDPATRMINSLRVSEYAQRSRKLAETVEEEFVKSGRLSRGAKQRDDKGIWVLQAVAMPAILIELGFLSDPEEEEFITSKEGQQKSAEAIAKAIKRYRISLEAQVNGRALEGN
ncbi:MAG: N-acetylmuramoyl-L-alanine amidase [Bacteroidota bacterium]